jgi:hypothetical protein
VSQDQFFFQTNAQFSRVIESSFHSHIVHEVTGRYRDQGDTIDWALRVGLGWDFWVVFYFLSLRARVASRTHHKKAGSKFALEYLPLYLSPHLKYHSNYRGKAPPCLSPFPFTGFQVCLLRPLMI